METYCLETVDGLLHLFTVVSRENDEVECETIHSDGGLTIRIRQTINAGLFELFVKLGLLRQYEPIPDLSNEGFVISPIPY